MSDNVDLSRQGAVQILRLLRPEKKNALTAAMYQALTDALVAGDGDDAIAAYVICGLPGVFTAGNDINDFLAHSQEQAEGEIARFVRHLPKIEKPLIAAVDGLAVGIGTTLLLHCDLVYATPDSHFVTPFVDLGLVPEAGSSLLGPRRFGYARAFEWLVLGAPFSAAQAHAAGLVNAVLLAGEVEAAARDAANKLARKPKAALRSARKLLRGDPSELDACIEAELLEFRRLLASDEARAAFQAFVTKR